MSEDLLLVGRVARAHGIRGHVIVNPETDFMEDRFKVGRTLHVGPAERAREHEILEVRFQQGRPIVRFDRIATMNEAEALAGSDLWLPASSIAPLPDRTFYRHDLVGCEVRDIAGRVLGRVTDVEGSIDRSYLIVDESTMIPMVDGICVAVDIAGRCVTVDPPDGLLDLYPGRR